MSKISKIFSKTKPLIAFIMAGDPSLSSTETFVIQLEKAGADIVEIGIPFSDSIADGPVIVESAQRAIENGTDAEKCFKLVKKLRSKTKIPIIFMTSYNIIHCYGPKKFIFDCKLSKVDGLIVPDLPIEETMEISKLAKLNDVDLIFLIAPNTDINRAKKISKMSTGFIYFISLTGTTGVRKKLSESLKDDINKVRKITNKPIAVGFGISTPKQVKEVSKYADGIIIGSAIIKRIREGRSLLPFVSALKKSISS